MVRLRQQRLSHELLHLKSQGGRESSDLAYGRDIVKMPQVAANRLVIREGLRQFLDAASRLVDNVLNVQNATTGSRFF